MSRRRGAAVALVTLAVALATTLTPSAAGGVPRPPKVSVIVVLGDQTDVGAIEAPTRRARLAAVEQALSNEATITQASLVDLLTERQQQGLVASFTPLWVVNGIAVTADQAVIAELAARPEVAAIQPDRTFEAPAATATTPAAVATPEANVAKINAPALWDLGFRGQGIVVASMDTGVDATHPDLAGSWRGGTNSWYDPNGEHATPTDVNGHGTWTMGAMVGGDAGGTAIGVAPGASWIAVKIFNDQGVATSTGIHQGFQWLLDPDGNPATPDAPNVVNDSWTMSSGGCALDFQADLQNLRAAGILPVFAAGNDGPNANTSASPANNPDAFAVGSVDGTDTIAPSSSRGPSACDATTFPELVAPGVNIHTTDLYGGYVDESGTSIAAPEAAGALALLLDAFPGLTADRQAAALTNGALDLGAPGADDTYGLGRLDVLASYQWLRSVPDFSLGAAPSSGTVTAGGTTSFTVTSTAANGFTTDVALSLSGLPAQVGSASFSPSTLSGGGGSSQLTISTPASAPPGTYPLTITGTGGSTSHTTGVTLAVSAPQQPDFTMLVTPGTASVKHGKAATFLVVLTPTGGFTKWVKLSATGLPPNATVTFKPKTTPLPVTSTMKVKTAWGTPKGTYTITVTAVKDSSIHTATVVLTVR